MPLLSKLPLGLALLLYAPLAVAQSNLGELLDAGAKKLSADEFRQELVQHAIAGPTMSGGSLEVVYTANGSVQGAGFAPQLVGTPLASAVSGDWTIDSNGRICTGMWIGGGPGAGRAMGFSLPARCEFWFNLAEQYFLSVSDSDGHARVLRRTVKQ